MGTDHIDIYDTTVSVWEKTVDESAFRKRVYLPVLRFLRSSGWVITEDSDIKQHYSRLTNNHRSAFKGEFVAHIETSGRCFKFELWQETHNIAHKAGGRYEFGKRQRMPYLLGLRCDLETRKLVAFLQKSLGYEVTDRRLPKESADAAIQRLSLSSGHYRPALGRADWHAAYNRTSGDGKLLEHGQTVWFYGHDGRLRRGTAFYNLNNMWWVRLNRFEFTNQSCGYLLTAPPADVRTKRNEKRRRERLEQEMQKATESMDFARAQTLKRILFGNGRLYRIWANQHQCWYRSNSCGYTSQTTHAGVYVEPEAMQIISGSRGELEARPVA